jgi:hypothetical protein
MITNKRGISLILATAGSLLIAASLLAQPTEGCYVKVYDGENFQGRSALWLGPGSDADLRDNRWADSNEMIGDDVDSLITGPDTYFEGFEEPNFQGTLIKVGPNTRIADIHAVGGDDIESFRLLEVRPQVGP